jgi:tetratricopeptide (TPR) repeat protein
VECFHALGQGSGLQAEVALYEAARLSEEYLHDAPRALRLLDAYERRFPGGKLRTEVEWLRVQSLERAGRLDEALNTSETLLATPSGRRIASDLHFLRGRIYQDKRGDCASAASEFVAMIGETGLRGDEAELRRAQCLEKLGRHDDAVAAYERYLRRPRPASETKARERLLLLREQGFRPKGHH